MEKELNIIWNYLPRTGAEASLSEKEKKAERTIHVVSGLSLFTLVKNEEINPKKFYEGNVRTLAPSAPEWDIAWNTFFAGKKLAIPETLSMLTRMKGSFFSAGFYLFRDYVQHCAKKGDDDTFIERHRIKRIPHKEVSKVQVTLAHLVNASWSRAKSFREKNDQVVVQCNERGFRFNILNRIPNNCIVGNFYANPQEEVKDYFGQILDGSFDMMNFFLHAKKNWPKSSRYWNVIWNQYTLSLDDGILIPPSLFNMAEGSVGRYLFAHLLLWSGTEKKEIEAFRAYHQHGKYDGSYIYPSLLEIKNADWSNFYKTWEPDETVIILYQNLFLFGTLFSAKPRLDEFVVETEINTKKKRVTCSRDMIGKRRRD